MQKNVTLSSKGQVTIPKAVRDFLEVKPGDQVAFVQRGNVIVVEPVAGHLLSWYGTAKVAEPQDWRRVREQTMAQVAAEMAHEGTDEDGEVNGGEVSGGTGA